MHILNPTPVPELNEVLKQLITGIKKVLGENFLGAYLGGSFAHGGWDAYSDVDFNVVIERDLTPEELSVLKVHHARVYVLDCYYARHLEGVYFPRVILGDLDQTSLPLWYLDNGSLNFERSTHDNTLVNRWVLREQGVILAGPDPQTWIPRIPEGRLKGEVRYTMLDWGREIMSGAYLINNRWAQTFTVLSYSRMLHTLATGQIQSKVSGAAWAKETLASDWVDLIDDALSARNNQYEKVFEAADPEKIRRTLSFIRYAMLQVTSKKAYQHSCQGDFDP